MSAADEPSLEAPAEPTASSTDDFIEGSTGDSLSNEQCFIFAVELMTMDNGPIQELLRRVREEAERLEVCVDRDIYTLAGRDPVEPILFAGSPDAPIAVVGRDLGREEVLAGQPLIGSAGRRVRSALYRMLTGNQPPEGDRSMETILPHVLLTNTVPFKPVGNKCYPTAVRERFRPFLAELLTCHWKGHCVITLGTEAFRWFEPYAPAGAIEAFWKDGDRFEAEMACVLEVVRHGTVVHRPVTVAPLPHPSPLNQAYLARFPGLLDGRLRKALAYSRDTVLATGKDLLP